jgi:ATP-binding cassette subfamily B protein
MQIIRYFWRHVWRYKWLVIGASIAIPSAIFFLWFVPSLIIADMFRALSSGDFVPGDLWASFGPELVWYTALVLFSGIFLWRIAIYFVWTLERHVLRNIHREIFAHLMQLSAAFHANHFGGSLVSQANKLSGAFVRMADTTWFNLYGLILSFIFAMVILLPLAPTIAILLLVFSVAFMAGSIYITRIIRKLSSKLAARETKQTGFLADVVTNVLAVKSFAGGTFERNRYGDATDKTAQATHKLMWASLKRESVFALETTTIGIIALLFAIGGVVADNADVGTAFLIVTYTGMITMRLWEFGNVMLRNYNRALGDSREMVEILGIEPEIKDPLKPEKPRIKEGIITFDNMSFTHPESRDDDSLFVDLNLEIAAGEKIGLVGHSGSGKTTLTKLLLRFTDVDGGAILIDGQNIAHITQDDLRRNIAYVPQEPLLFHRTIRENIAYGKPDASDKEIEQAAQKAHAAEFIEKLPNKYETIVGERGVKLSGGQRQRIAIARAILKDAPILLLDEATSALDSESEKLIQAALWELMKGRTTIVIAHRLSTIQKMDRIVVLDNGKIVEEGSHSTLLEKKGQYAKLWAHQSGGFIDD